MISKVLFFTLIALNATPAWADTFSDAQKKQPPTACEQIEQKCMKAGYTRSTPKGSKDLDDDCFAPVLNGQKVVGVNVSRQQAEECLGSMPRKPVKSLPSHH